MNTREQATRIPEQAPIPEAPNNNDAMLGVTTRLLLGGESLNPDQHVPEVIAQNLRLSDETTNIIARASKHNRSEFWEGRAENTFDTRIAAWKAQTRTAVSALNTRFGEDTEKRDRWQSVFSRVGITDMANFSEENSATFYNTYFAGENGESNVSLFVENIAQNYLRDGQPVNYDEFYKDTKAIAWLATTFGEKIADTIPSLIEARLMRDDDVKRTEVATKANTADHGITRVNRLTDGQHNEKEALTYIWQHGREETPEPSPEEPVDRTVNTLPRVMIREDQPDTAHIAEMAAQEAPRPPDKDYDTADRLVDYATGRVKPERINLLSSFTDFLRDIENKLDADTVIDPRQPHLALSPVARAMLDRLATDSNNRDRELIFIVMGVPVQRNGKTVLAGAYIVPASNYQALERTSCESHDATFQANSIQLAENTGLERFFRQRTGFNDGKIVGVLHTHQEPLGTGFEVTPSEQDYRTAVVNAQDNGSHPWGVVTKIDDTINTNFIYTTHESATNQTRHQSYPLFSA